MARSAFTLAAAVTAALPGAEVTGARPLSAGGEGRYDSAVATLSDGSEVAIRVSNGDEAERELASEALALRALTTGARAMLPFEVPEYIGETRVGDGRALVTSLLDGFLVDAADIPAGRGAAVAAGRSIAAIHALPTSVVRSAGLPARSAEDVRAEVRQIVDRASATGRVPARLTVRWREATDDDELWRFESAVTLGGAHAASFLFTDDPEEGPQVTGVIGWHGLSIGDPAVDLAWLSSAPDAANDVQAAYTAASDRTPDQAVGVRARLIAELEFARWLVHGDAQRREDIVDDAATLLTSLAEGLRDEDLAVIAERGDALDSALDAFERVPVAPASAVDTSMQTDTYDPRELWLETAPVEPVGDPDATSDLSDLATSEPRPDEGSEYEAAEGQPEDEAQRAARAALHRWTNSSSE
jgi:aminoglycoside phosphotransferase (APT) family kinase protein